MRSGNGQKRGHMQSQIRTVLKHEHTSSSPNKERGSRYWAAAEVMSATWFVIETCIEEAGRNEIKRWVTTSIGEAAKIQHSQAPFIWSQIYACLRAPQSVRSATVFEVVKEAYQLGPAGSFLYRLENGMSFATDEGLTQGVQSEPTELKLLYAQQR